MEPISFTWVLCWLVGIYLGRRINWPKWDRWPGLSGFLFGFCGHVLGIILLLMIWVIQSPAPEKS